MEHTPVSSGFNNLGLASKIVDILTYHKYTEPTPIQSRSIPIGLAGKDMVGIAQTGTGKTLAFGLPMIQRLAQLKAQGLVLVPTRELALQVEETLRKIGSGFGMKTAVVIGGASMHTQINELRRKPHIIVATPGRLADHLKQRTVSLNQVQVVVLDEADRMLDIGFAPQIKEILSVIPIPRQTLLFSATMPTAIAAIAHKFMVSPERVEVTPAGTSVALVEQSAYIVPKEMKLRLLEKLLTDNTGTVLIFSRTKHGAKKIAAAIRSIKHTAVEIHSNRTLAQRKAALHGFKSGIYRVMVATDIAARGIDVKDISLVINFDLPDNSEDYVHRIGRTGRAGSTGRAISFVEPQRRGEIRQIERLTRKTLPILPMPANLPASTIVHTPDTREHSTYRSARPPQHRGGYGRSSGRHNDHRRGERRESQPQTPNTSHQRSYHRTFRRTSSEARKSDSR